MFERNFIYQSLVEEFVASPVGTTLLTGGRGTGKTMVLQELERALKDRAGDECKGANFSIFISGFPSDAAAKAVKEAAHDKTYRYVFLDDLDVLLMNLDRDRPAVIKDLMYVVAKTNATENRVFITSSTPKRRLTALVSDEGTLSYILQKPQQCPLNPWMPSWERRLHELSMAVLRNSLKGKDKDAGGCELWVNAAIQLSGGHPTLFFPALQYLARLLRDSGGKVPDVPDVKQRLRNHLTSSSMSDIKFVVEGLSTATGEEEQKAFRTLMAIARAGGCIEYAMGSREQDDLSLLRLEEEALFYYSADDEWVIPGEMLVKEIAGNVASGEEVFQLRPDPGAPAHQGEVIRRVGGEEQAVELGGQPWQILYYLASQDGQGLVPREQIVEHAGLKKKASFRNAYNQLKKKLLTLTETKLTENRRGQGYRCRVPITIID